MSELDATLREIDEQLGFAPLEAWWVAVHRVAQGGHPLWAIIAVHGTARRQDARAQLTGVVPLQDVDGEQP